MSLTHPAPRAAMAAAPVVGWTVHALVMRRRIEQARRDPLTGLRTRTSWSQQAERVLRGRRRAGAVAAVLLLDLDGFKQVNDTYGHAAGDDLLVAVARCLEAWADGRGYAGRIGGDEFVAVVRIGEHDLVNAVRELHAAIGRPVELRRAGPVSPWASVGVAGTAEHPGADLARLMSRADAAMYVAKAARSGVRVADEYLPEPVPVNGRRPGRPGTSTSSSSFTPSSREAAA